MEDICHSIETYGEVDEFDTTEEIEEGMALVNQLSRDYRHLHVELRAELGSEVHGQNYPNYDEVLKMMSEFLKKARAHMKTIKDKVVKIDPEQNEKFVMLRVNRDVLDMKIKQVNDSIDLKTVSDICDINEYIVKLEMFLSEYFDISGQYKYFLGEELMRRQKS